MTDDAELKKAGLKVTLPRLRILELLESSDDSHLSAEDIYRKLINAGEEVGLATVYRVLTQFEQAGICIKHNFEEGHGVYELTPTHHHDHMVCVETGDIIEFSCEEIEDYQIKVAKEKGYEIIDHSMVLYVKPLKNNKLEPLAFIPILLDRRIDLSNKEKENGLDQEEDLLEDQLDESNERPVEEAVELSLEQQVEDLKDQLLRAQAEVQNVRRVAGQEITKARLYGVESLAREFMVVGDNLQRVLESCNEKAEINSIKEGLELTLRSFEGSLETAGIVPINPDGESFDPEKHEAISVVEDDKKEPNTVIDVIQRGFTIQNRILRPAKVVVTKKPDKK